MVKLIAQQTMTDLDLLEGKTGEVEIRRGVRKLLNAFARKQRAKTEKETQLSVEEDEDLPKQVNTEPLFLCIVLQISRQQSELNTLYARKKTLEQVHSREVENLKLKKDKLNQLEVEITDLKKKGGGVENRKPENRPKAPKKRAITPQSEDEDDKVRAGAS